MTFHQRKKKLSSFYIERYGVKVSNVTIHRKKFTTKAVGEKKNGRIHINAEHL